MGTVLGLLSVLLCASVPCAYLPTTQSSSASLFWYSIPQAASHEECLSYQSSFCHEAFFFQVALQLLQYLFHA